MISDSNDNPDEGSHFWPDLPRIDDYGDLEDNYDIALVEDGHLLSSECYGW